MPRNSSGVYSPPSGNPVVDGTLIESVWANSTIGDIGIEITGSLPRNGTAPMTAPLILHGTATLGMEAVSLSQVNSIVNANIVDNIVALRAVSPGVSPIQVLGYLAPGDGGGGPYRVWKTGSVGTYVDNGGSVIVPTGGDGSGAWVWENNDVINVMWFGAVLGDSGDNSTAINAAIDYARTILADEEHTFVVHFPPASYRIDSGIDLTNIRSTYQTKGLWTVSGYGATIVGNFTGTMMDCTRSIEGKIAGLHFFGDSVNTPTIGLQLARGNIGESSDLFYLQDLSFDGEFSFTTFYNFASERFIATHCSFVNKHSSSSSYCMVIDGRNKFSVSSAFYTMTIPTDTAQSCLGHLFLQCTFNKRVSGSAVFLTRTSRMTMINCYVVSYDAYGVIVSSDGSVLRHYELDVHFETAGLLSCFDFRVESGVTTLKIDGFKWIDNNPHASGSLINSAPTLLTTLKNAEINIPLTNYTLTNGMFYPPANYDVSGNVSFGEPGGTGVNIARFNGCLTLDDYTATDLPLSGMYSIFDDSHDGEMINATVEFETGSFTPYLVGATTAGVGTYTVQTGSYTRIGDRVIFNLRVVWTDHTGTGTARVHGLPITSTSVNNQMSAVSVYPLGVIFTGSGIVGIVAQDSNYISLNSPVSGSNTVNVAIGTAGTLNIAGSYRV